MSIVWRLLAGLTALAVAGAALRLGQRRARTDSASGSRPVRRSAGLSVARAASARAEDRPDGAEQAEVPPPTGGSLLFERWPRFACRHPWLVVAGALAFIAICGGLWASQRGEFGTGGFTLPGAESQKLVDLLQERFPRAAGDSAEIAVRAPAGLRTEAVRADVEALIAEAEALPEVLGVISPYNAPGRISADGEIARITVQYAATASDLADSSIGAIFAWREEVSREGLQVELGGIVAGAGEQEPPGNAELIGLAAAAVILLIAFGTVTAAGLPIFTALLALIPAFFLIGVGASFINLASFTPQFAAMIGIGVGIDYALLVVTRFREALANGMTVPNATVKAASTAGHAVLFAGCSVVIALMGLWTVGVPLLSLTAMGPALAVALAAAVALLVLPAILALVGERVNRLSVPGLRVSAIQSETGIAYRLGRTIQRAPWIWLVAAAVLLLALAFPTLDMRLGSSDAGSNPTSLTSRRAYDLLAEGFGVGFNGPILVGAALESEEQAAAFASLPAQIAGDPNIASITPAVLSEDGTAGTMLVIPTSSPQDEATGDLVHRLRDRLPELLTGTDVDVLVGGPTATFIDLGDRVGSRMPVFLTAVIGASFLLLLVIFRSLLVPLKAAAMNVLAAGAAYGVLVAIFQWGWGADAIGLDGTGPIESFLPMMMFAVLFGLSMDYEVFLVSRVREEYLATGDNGEAVVRGLAATSRVISAAAAIMVAVFLSFALSDQRVIKEFGIGLSVAIFLDATVIRLVLVPAIMHTLSDANWWLPHWLARLVPHVGVKAPARREPLPEAGER